MYQTTNVNNISGATLSSFAIKAAVNKCLKEAGLDVKQFQKPAPKPAHYNDTVTEDTNIVIVGAGGAGLSAAVAAAESGKKVIRSLRRTDLPAEILPYPAAASTLPIATKTI